MVMFIVCSYLKCLEKRRALKEDSQIKNLNVSDEIAVRAAVALDPDAEYLFHGFAVVVECASRVF